MLGRIEVELDTAAGLVNNWLGTNKTDTDVAAHVKRMLASTYNVLHNSKNSGRGTGSGNSMGRVGET